MKIAVLYCMYHMCLCPVLVYVLPPFGSCIVSPCQVVLLNLPDQGFHGGSGPRVYVCTIAAWAHADKSEHHYGMSIYKEGEQQIEKAAKFP